MKKQTAPLSEAISKEILETKGNDFIVSTKIFLGTFEVILLFWSLLLMLGEGEFGFLTVPLVPEGESGCLLLTSRLVVSAWQRVLWGFALKGCSR
jgi:hypothetical protein